MRDLQRLNPRPDTATNAMCTFLAINTGSVQLIPVTAIAVLAANGSKNPTWIVGTTLLATLCSSLTGLLVVKSSQRLRWFRMAEGLTASPTSPYPAEEPKEAHEAVLPNAPRPLGWAGRCGLLALLLCFAGLGGFLWR
jgi:hypothetical protein